MECESAEVVETAVVPVAGVSPVIIPENSSSVPPTDAVFRKTDVFSECDRCHAMGPPGGMNAGCHLWVACAQGVR